MKYEDHLFKVPIEADDYEECSIFLTSTIEKIISESIRLNKNKILIDTNLKLGIPMENINKIAGPFIEAWVCEIFSDLVEDERNKYELMHVEVGERLNLADVVLQFRRHRKTVSSVTGHVDVKATSKDIPNSGKSPNITSFSRIRSEYVKNPDLIFIILSIKHSVYSKRNSKTHIHMMMGVMEIVSFNAYDLKFISGIDISYNPALGSGQIQVRDIHYISSEIRTTWEFCQLLDKKCIASKKGYSGWLEYAIKNHWIKDV